MKLWTEKKLVVSCPACAGQALIVGATNKDTSNVYDWHGICPECKKLVSGSLPFLEIYGRSLKSKMAFSNKHHESLDKVIRKLKDAQRDEIEIKTFSDNLDLILNNREKVFSDPRLYCCGMKAAYIGGTMTGTRKIFLGALIEIWNEGKLTDTCSSCGGKVLILGAGGSNLSGRHSWHGICSACKKWKFLP